MTRARLLPRLPMLAAATVLALLVLCALWPALLAPADPLAVHPANGFLPPSPEHWFGTDESGRDLFTRVVHGAGPSLLIGVCATAIGVGLAVVLGTAAGLGPRWLDFGTTRLIEILFAFPGLLLALLIIVVAGQGAGPSTLAVGLATAPGYARILRSRLLVVRRAPYVEAEIVLGRGPLRRLTRTVLPQASGALFVLATLGLGQSIVWASSLSFLGLGTPPPAAEWGAMLAAGRTYLSTAWWLTFFPGLAIVLAAASATVLGRGLRTAGRQR